jgi:hypothetical protein
MTESPWPHAQLPRWALLLREHSDFDPFGPWCSIYCTSHDRHDPELLGVVYEGTHGDRRYAGPHIRLSETNEAQLDAQAAVSDDPVGVLWRGGPRGSVNLTCPTCHLMKRVPRKDWSRLTDALQIPDRFDVSRLP